MTQAKIPGPLGGASERSSIETRHGLAGLRPRPGVPQAEALRGPLNGSVGAVGGRIPGPLGFHVVVMAPGPVVAANTVQTIMPTPTKDQDSKDVHEVTWPLYNPKTKGPAFVDVKQSQSLANCPVAAILSAFAFTALGRSYIEGMLSEKSGNVVTDLSALPADALTNPPQGNTVASKRYFSVKLPGGSVVVSDVLYTNDADRNWSLLYMRDPSERSLWASIIEKALAVQLKGYENFDALNLSANAFWEKVTGAKPGGIAIKADTPLPKIIDAAKEATRVPTIGASKPDSTDVKVISAFHGFAMLGVEGGKIKLYDPAITKTLLITPAEFRQAFEAILYRK